ncbi:hypothetical protein SORBI_3010G136600 [Sorghum bicolor]|uniref:Uncharacterized protein n=1 Tax=Sorghum bicolor TaxID=4558 RepID=A0A1W0VSU7_SORBI|nr:hypothetical protein SORBI_3010G136600 [Sorghum bicolor]
MEAARRNLRRTSPTSPALEDLAPSTSAPGAAGSVRAAVAVPSMASTATAPKRSVPSPRLVEQIASRLPYAPSMVGRSPASGPWHDGMAIPRGRCSPTTTVSAIHLPFTNSGGAGPSPLHQRCHAVVGPRWQRLLAWSPTAASSGLVPRGGSQLPGCDLYSSHDPSPGQWWICGAKGDPVRQPATVLLLYLRVPSHACSLLI